MTRALEELVDAADAAVAAGRVALGHHAPPDASHAVLAAARELQAAARSGISAM